MAVNQKGQIFVEAVLLIVVLMAGIGIVFKILRETEYVKKLTVEPWGRVVAMVECGSWNDPCGVSNSGPKKLHPSNRVVSLGKKTP